MNGNASEIQGYVDTVLTNRADIEPLLANLEQDVDPTIREKASAFRQLFPRWVSLQDQILTLGKQNTVESNDRAAAISMGEAASVNNAMIVLLDDLNALITEDMSVMDQETNVQFETSRNLLFAATGLTLILSVGVALWISMTISAGLRRAIGLADAISIGDLNQKIEHKANDEIRDLANSLTVMTDNLRASATIADQIAGGDLTVEPKRLSEKDTLGCARAHG
jgi:methyl-accepting chemotaxis protein